MNETLKLPLIMVGPQYEPDERTFMAVEYFKRCGKRDFMGGIINDFRARYPNAAHQSIPSRHYLAASRPPGKVRHSPQSQFQGEFP